MKSSLRPHHTLKCCYKYDGTPLRRSIVVIVDWQDGDGNFHQAVISRKEVRKMFGVCGLRPKDVLTGQILKEQR